MLSSNHGSSQQALQQDHGTPNVSTPPETVMSDGLDLSDSPDKTSKQTRAARPRSSSTSLLASRRRKPPILAAKNVVKTARAVSSGPLRTPPIRMASPIPAVMPAPVPPPQAQPPSHSGQENILARLATLEMQQAAAHKFMTELAVSVGNVSQITEHVRARNKDAHREIDETRHVLFETQTDLHNSKAVLE